LARSSSCSPPSRAGLARSHFVRWRVEVRGSGRHNCHRYRYQHGLEAGQMELPLAAEEQRSGAAP
jgi:hypothetical protein